MGSASELEYQILLSQDLGYLDQEAITETTTELSEIKHMLNAFLQKPRANR